MKAITNLSVRVIERWLPDAFLFAIILTIVVFIAAMVGTGVRIFFSVEVLMPSFTALSLSCLYVMCSDSSGICSRMYLSSLAKFSSIC